MTKARRVDERNDPREIHVAPSGSSDVTVRLAIGPTRDGYSGICTADGRVLSHQLSITASGPDGWCRTS